MMMIWNTVSRGFDSVMRWAFGAKIVQEEADFWRGIAGDRSDELLAAQREIARLKQEKGFR